MRRALILTLGLALAACGSSHDCPAPTSPARVAFGSDAALTVQVAASEAARARGLMGVAHLPADRGMAFEFGGSTTATFWMKDTLIPLSIVFIDGDRVVAIREMTPCDADPCPSYSAGAPYTLAVEANAGWFGDHGIEVGDRVDNFSGSGCN